MRKGTATTIALVIVLLLAGLGFGLPYYTGLQTEKHFRQTLETILEDSPVVVKDYQYKRGLFSAEASVPLEVKVGKEAYLIPVEYEIQHGICPMNMNFAKVTGSVRLPTEAPAWIKAFFGDQSPLKVTTVIALDRSMRTEIGSPSFNGRLPGENQPEILWKGISGTISLSPDWKRGTMALLAPSLTVQEESGARFTFDSFEMKGDLHRGSTEEFWLGVSRAGLRKFSVVTRSEQGAETESAAADHCLLSVDVTGKEGLLAATYTLGFDKLKAAGRDFDKAVLETRLGNLDNQVLIGLRDKLRALNKQEVDDNTRNQESLKAIFELLPKFLARSPEVTILRLAVSTSEGQIEGAGRLKYIGDQNLESFQALKDLEGEARLTAPKQLVQSLGLAVLGIGGKDLDEALGEKAEDMKRQLVQQRIDELVGDNVILDQGSTYSSHVVLKAGVLTLNGKPLDLPPGS